MRGGEDMVSEFVESKTMYIFDKPFGTALD
jgi:hypothetical protein